MADPQSEPFVMALSVLRERVQYGVLPPGARITAVEIADELGLSTTPVREALSRLAGEDLLEERRGQGYFIRRFNGAEIADLYRLSLAMLLIALDPKRARRASATETGGEPVLPRDPVTEVEQAFLRWVIAAGTRPLVRDFRILQIRLGPARRVEAQLLGDLAIEAEAIVRSEDLARPDRLNLLRQFHGARIRDAERLAGVMEGLSSRPRK